MYLMVENNMHGCIAMISYRHAVTNNPLVEGHDPSKPHLWIEYLDVNNLYGCSMSETLLVGKLQFVEQQEIEKFDIMSIPADADRGYIVECGLMYPEALLELDNDYPMAPEHSTEHVE